MVESCAIVGAEAIGLVDVGGESSGKGVIGDAGWRHVHSMSDAL